MQEYPATFTFYQSDPARKFQHSAGRRLWAGDIRHPKPPTHTKQNITTAGIALAEAAAVVFTLRVDHLPPGEAGVVELQ